MMRCAHCGTAFTPGRADAVTCSKVCRQRRWRAQQAEARRAARDAETLDRLLTRRATTRDGTGQVDGLAPYGVQTLIPTGDDTREAVDGILAAHQLRLGPDNRPWGCACGDVEVLPRGTDPCDTAHWLELLLASHAAHVARVLVSEVPTWR